MTRATPPLRAALPLTALLLPIAMSCSGAPSSTAARSAGGVTPAAVDSARGDGLVPAGYGTLRQDEIAIRLQLEGVQVRAIPLDEAVIRTLSPDSYRALRDLQASRRAEVEQIARRAGIHRPALWYVSYFGLVPQARFSPREFIVTNNGRDFRPLEILPLSPGFGEQRLNVRETQAAIYVFDGALDAGRPLTVRLETTQNDDWQTILRRIEREQAMIRSRAGG